MKPQNPKLTKKQSAYINSFVNNALECRLLKNNEAVEAPEIPYLRDYFDMKRIAGLTFREFIALYPRSRRTLYN